MERFKKAYTFIFSEKGWENKVLVIYAVLVIASIIGAILSFMFTLPVEILSAILQEQGRDVKSLDSMSSSLSSINSLFTLPVMIYVYGYLIEVVRNMTDGAKTVLVENKNIKEKLLKGVKFYVTLFLATLPATIVGGILFIVSVIGAVAMFSLAQNNPIFMIAGIALVLLTIILAVLLGILNSIITYASMYIYFKTNSFRSACTYKNIFETIRNNEKSLLNIFVDFLVMGVFEFFFVIVFFIPLLCVAPFVFPFISLVSMFAKAYIISDRFKMMSTMKGK
jgi:hypothetical protein